MATIYYSTAFIISLIFMLVYAFSYHKHYDIHITIIFVLIPINNLASLYYNESDSLEAALLANKIVYISSCYLILMITLVVFSLCDIKLNRYIRLLLYVITTVVFFFTQQIGENGLYYKSAVYSDKSNSIRLYKEYGPLHTVYYCMVIAYFSIILVAIVYSFLKKTQVSNRFIALLALPEIISVIAFFGGRWLADTFTSFPKVELTPLTYDLALVIFLMINHRVMLYDIPETVIDTVVQKGETGFISFDFGFRYLGSNETAKNIFPGLKDCQVDKPLTSDIASGKLLEWLKEFSRDNSKDKTHYNIGEKSYLVIISFLSDGKHDRGYQLYIEDDTQDQQYIALLDNFNTELRSEIAQKTEHIIEMHDNLILSMATMVESRDNSTGGHIRRTSDCVRILIDEMKGSRVYRLSEKFCRDIIKAAPMHDLGKIAVDDAILRKPGRFTDAEYAVMKTHAAEGARIVHEILKSTDDDEFRILAENVAHYHHEHWDGSGYPEGLKGADIPLEARIMAIADVYDALVSKRVYKEKMSFEKADQIIMEGMGKHFDKQLEPYYRAARPRLEQYYSELE